MACQGPPKAKNNHTKGAARVNNQQNKCWKCNPKLAWLLLAVALTTDVPVILGSGTEVCLMFPLMALAVQDRARLGSEALCCMPALWLRVL